MVRTQGPGSGVASIAGGFVPVPVACLMGVWRSCRARPLGIGDFRCWLACREIQARRSFLEEGRTSAFTFAELARLLGVSERRASVGRLVAAGFLRWSGSAIDFPDSSGQADDLVDSIGGGRGSVAIPRRMLRFLVDGARPALIAAVLGILLRCLSRRKGGFDGGGRVKASWIARLFGVDERRVKTARRELVDLGWIETEAADQWSLNHWGACYRINLNWDRGVGRRLPPPTVAESPTLPRLDLHPEPLREIKHQEPAGRGPAGVRLEGEGRGDRTSTPALPPIEPRPSPPSPRLDDVRPEDLRDTGRTLALFDQAAGRGLVGSSEADRLQFIALAEHARAVGRANPPGLFAQLLRGRCWRYITAEDEDRARARLREHFHPSRPPERPLGRVSTFVPDRPAAGPTSLADVMAGLRLQGVGILGVTGRTAAI